MENELITRRNNEFRVIKNQVMRLDKILKHYKQSIDMDIKIDAMANDLKWLLIEFNGTCEKIAEGEMR